MIQNTIIHKTLNLKYSASVFFSKNRISRESVFLKFYTRVTISHGWRQTICCSQRAIGTWFDSIDVRSRLHAGAMWAHSGSQGEYGLSHAEMLLFPCQQFPTKFKHQNDSIIITTEMNISINSIYASYNTTAICKSLDIILSIFSQIDPSMNHLPWQHLQTHA